MDVTVCVVSAVLVALAFHVFANQNNFAPGGVNGLAAITGYLTGTNMGYFNVLYNTPIFILVFIFIDRRTGSMLTFYVVCQSAALILMEHYRLPYYKTDDNLIFAALGTGIVSGFGFSVMLKRFGSSGGTYAIAALIKRFRQTANIAWVSFFMDSFVVIIAFFVYDFKIEPVLCTLVNLFVANVVVDKVIKGVKMGYKFEIVTTEPEELSHELLEKLGHGVSCTETTGMYTHQKKYILTCIVRKRQIADFYDIMKRYPGNFAYLSQINEVMGKFKE